MHLPNGETSVKRAVVVIDAVGIHTNFTLWDEQLPLADLFKEGDVLAIQQPFVIQNESESFILEYGPMTVVFCQSRELVQEFVQSQTPQATPVSVTKDCHGNLDYSSFPERVYITDIRTNVGHVTLFGVINAISEKQIFQNGQIIGQKFVVQIRDESGDCQVKVFDDSCSYHESLCIGQCIILEGLQSMNAGPNLELQLLSHHGGIIWNLSKLTGWLSTKYLGKVFSLATISESGQSNCIAKAVIIQIKSKDAGSCVRVHSSCLQPVMTQPGKLWCCQECGASHLIQRPSKPGSKVGRGIVNVAVNFYFQLIFVFIN